MVVPNPESRHRGLNGARIAIRMDASVAIGSGHAMRCLTLGGALKSRGASVMFLSRSLPGNLNRLIHAKGFKMIALPSSDSRCAPTDDGEDYRGFDAVGDAEACAVALNGHDTDWLVVDHYGIDAHWEHHLRCHTRNIMVIDDLADRSHDCELLLDQNISRTGAARYDGLLPPACSRLVGPRYALLREEFRRSRLRRQRSGTSSPYRVFVFFGGADACNITGRALRALNRPEFSNLEIDVVVGSSNPHLAAVRGEAARNPAVTLHVDVDDMAACMIGSDFALGAGGVATWERCCIGLPTLVVTVASNQRPAIAELHQRGAVEWLGDEGDIEERDIRRAIRDVLSDPASLREMRRRARAVVDGRGTARVVDFLEQGIPERRWRIRAAREADSALFFSWANDPDVRDNAFDTRPIQWEIHRRWFSDKLADPGAHLLVAEAEEGPIGQVRFEQRVDRFVISYSLGRQFRGKGLGRGLLIRAIEVLRKSVCAPLVAEIRTENVPSARVFESLGFLEIAPCRPGSRRFELPVEVCP